MALECRKLESQVDSLSVFVIKRHLYVICIVEISLDLIRFS